MLHLTLKTRLTEKKSVWPGTLVGVGMTAFSRIVPAGFIQNYRIVALRETSDLPIIREEVPVFCLEEETSLPVHGGGMNSARLLEEPAVLKHLRALPGPVTLFLYQSYPEIEERASREGWKTLANPSQLRQKLARREYFLDAVNRLGLPNCGGRVVHAGGLHVEAYENWADLLGKRFVVQLTDITQGGGRGTFFIASPEDYAGLLSNLKTRAWRGVRIKNALLRTFVEGISASVAVCIQDRKIIQSRLQKELIDLNACNGVERGVFCGHTWDGEPWPDGVENEVRRQANLLSLDLQQMGYRGILGIDFILSRTGQVFPLEINPRLTGAFPLLSLFHMAGGLLPMEAYHISALSEAAPSPPPKETEGFLTHPVRGSHVLLFERGQRSPSGWTPPPSGLYTMSNGAFSAKLKGNTCRIEALKDDSHFLLVEVPLRVPPARSATLDPLERIGRLIFPHPATQEDGSLTPAVQGAVDWFYGMNSGAPAT